MKTANTNIFKQAWQITKTHRFLHLFGLFLILPVLPLIVQDFFLPENLAKDQSPLALGLNLASVVLYLLSLWAAAGLIVAVKTILDREPTGFGAAWKAGRMFVGRIFLTEIIIGITLLLVGLVLMGTVSYFMSHENSGAVAVLGALAGAIGVAAVITAFLVQIFSRRFVVVFDQKVQESLDRSLGLLGAGIWKTLGFALLTGLIQMVPVVFLSILTYYIHGLASTAVIVAISLAAQIVIMVFIETAWVIKFLELVRPEKIDEEILPVAETAN